MRGEPFLGRERELEELTEKIFFNGGGSDSASLAGPPGIGKRTLLDRAERRFREAGMPNVFIVRTTFFMTPTLNSFLLDILRQMTVELRRHMKDSADDVAVQDILREMRDLEAQMRSGSLLQEFAEQDLMDVFKNMMELFLRLDLHMILVVNGFDYLIDGGVNESERHNVAAFFFKISKKSESQWNLRTLLVCERRPQFIVSKADLPGSDFESAYRPILLHCFDEKEMKEYFSSYQALYCGVPQEAVQKEIVKYCGRLPDILMRFRSKAAALSGLGTDDVKRLAEKIDRNSHYRRFCTLMRSQFLDDKDSHSLYDAFRSYFVEKRRDEKTLADVHEIYQTYGLADWRDGSNYAPLTEDCDMPESEPLSFLSFLQNGEEQVAGYHAASHSDADSSVIASWLHLSDLHVSEELDKDMILREFKRLSNVIHPDFLIVTGDFRDKARRTDFNLAETYLTDIMQSFHFAPDDVFLVPGNHDADVQDAERTAAIQHITENSGNYNAFQEKIPVLNRKFSEYGIFCKDFYHPLSRDDPRFSEPVGTHTLVWREKLNLLCVNTALISDGDRSHGEIIDLYAFEEALDKLNRDIPTIMIGHHSLSQLTDVHQEHMERLLENDYSISAYLHGDIHQVIHKRGQTTLFPSVACGKSAPVSTDVFSDVGALYYEWKTDGKAYVRGFIWDKLHLHTYNLNGIEEDLSFDMKTPSVLR